MQNQCGWFTNLIQTEILNYELNINYYIRADIPDLRRMNPNGGNFLFFSCGTTNFEWNVLLTIGLIALKLYLDIHVNVSMLRCSTKNLYVSIAILIMLVDFRF